VREFDIVDEPATSAQKRDILDAPNGAAHLGPVCIGIGRWECCAGQITAHVALAP
jgi:hypothetical protein